MSIEKGSHRVLVFIRMLQIKAELKFSAIILEKPNSLAQIESHLVPLETGDLGYRGDNHGAGAPLWRFLVRIVDSQPLGICLFWPLRELDDVIGFRVTLPARRDVRICHYHAPAWLWGRALCCFGRMCVGRMSTLFLMVL